MSTALQSIKDQIKQDMATMRSSVPAVSGRNISTKGQVFTLPDGRSHQGPLNAVILDFRNFYKLYTKPYNPQNPVPPQCFAIGRDIPSMAPNDNAKEKQSDNCATCPQNKWGSDPNGGKGKACKNTVRIAVIALDADENDEPMILSASPTALSGWAGYCNGLEAAGLHPVQMVTEIDFEPSVSFPKLTFKALKPHDKLELAWRMREKAQTLLDQEPKGD